MKTVNSLTPVAPYSDTPRRRCARMPHHPSTVRRPQKHIPRNTAIRGAYTLLAAISIWTLFLDSFSRRDSTSASSPGANPVHVSIAPFPITPLAESPFPRKRNPASVAAVVPQSPETTAGTRRSAPTGIFFLRVPVQVQTVQGARSFDAGTRVRVVRNQAGKIRVSHEGTEFSVEEWQIRDEPDGIGGFGRIAS